MHLKGASLGDAERAPRETQGNWLSRRRGEVKHPKIETNFLKEGGDTMGEVVAKCQRASLESGRLSPIVQTKVSISRGRVRKEGGREIKSDER